MMNRINNSCVTIYNYDELTEQMNKDGDPGALSEQRARA